MVANLLMCSNLRCIQSPTLLAFLCNPQFHTISTQFRSQEKIVVIRVLSEKPVFQLDRCNNTIGFLLHFWFFFYSTRRSGHRNSYQSRSVIIWRKNFIQKPKEKIWFQCICQWSDISTQNTRNPSSRTVK